jgi:hypothetical protein
LRLAEFKTRLFIFFAGRLLKWAESIEQKIDPRQLPPPVDDSKTVVLAESSGESEAASGPPEHWARLATVGPPQHWLDLINQKAPHLLSPTGSELFSAEQGEEFTEREPFPNKTNQEANSPPASEAEAPSESQPSFLERNKSRATRDSSAKAGSRSWLNRLRFRPPVSSSVSDESVYVSDTRRSGGTASSVAGGAAEKGTAATPRHPRLPAIEPQGEMSDSSLDAMSALRDRIIRLSRNLSNKAHRSDPFAYQPKAKSSDSRRASNELQPPQSGPSHSLQPSLSSPGPVNEAEAEASANISPERGNSYVTNPPSRTSNESNEGRSGVSLAPKPISELKKLDRLRVVSLAKREQESPSLHFVHQPTEKRGKPETPSGQAQQSGTRRAGEIASSAPEPKTRDSSQSLSSAIGSFKPLVNSVSHHPRLRNEFASTDRAASKPNQLKTEAPENVWPALPVPPEFELADELAAMEREAEALRRLQHEQRGNPWNA